MGSKRKSCCEKNSKESDRNADQIGFFAWDGHASLLAVDEQKSTDDVKKETLVVCRVQKKTSSGDWHVIPTERKKRTMCVLILFEAIDSRHRRIKCSSRFESYSCCRHTVSKEVIVLHSFFLLCLSQEFSSRLSLWWWCRSEENKYPKAAWWPQSLTTPVQTWRLHLERIGAWR